MSAQPLSPQQLEEHLRELPGWAVVDGRLTRSYRLASHLAAAAFVQHVAVVQDELNHHADLTLGYRTVAVAVQTHDAGGALTDLDVGLAERVERVAPAHGAT
ncbi:4a-hydroxytetrahydrobiopterin dehydratase [Streptomyces sp. NPDC020412]|uniref:4a-hydroxytetrahydrobiopterin dehydratase n=1 Tax=Streptomyces sp. NPDC020412 TaxID=3365073 RepID=UPI0037A612B2